jgi:N-acyl amino acid synthase of PEP-CTERM/exosortase system
MSMQLIQLTNLPRTGHRSRRFLGSTYYDAFEGLHADSEELLAECFRVLHRIYCQERNFLPASEHPTGLETDAYDDHAHHGLLRYRRTGEAVGTVRLVLSRDASDDCGLPMYGFLKRFGPLDAALPPATETAEISRFAISKSFRRRLGDAQHGAAVDPNEDGRRMIPHMALGLMAMAFRMSMASGSRYLCAIMEPTLIRLLLRFGIRWQEVGPLRDYHGLRQACVAEIDAMAASISSERPDIWEFMTQPQCSTSPSFEDCDMAAA